MCREIKNQNNSSEGLSDNQENGQTSDKAQVRVLAQYIKDLSFENPNAPFSLNLIKDNPKLEIDLSVKKNELKDKNKEISMLVTVDAADKDGNSLFVIEITYCAVVTIFGLNEQNENVVTYIEIPRLLFPYVRQIVSSITSESGFPPLVLEPVNFVELYEQGLLESKEVKH